MATRGRKPKPETERFSKQGISVPPHIPAIVDRYAKGLGVLERRTVHPSNVYALAVELMQELCPLNELDREVDKERARARAIAAGKSGVGMLRSRLRANLAQVVEQRFRKPLLPVGNPARFRHQLALGLGHSPAVSQPQPVAKDHATVISITRRERRRDARTHHRDRRRNPTCEPLRAVANAQ